MSVLVDTGVLYAHHDADAARHDDARDAMDDVLDGAFGRPSVPDYVFDEAVTLARRRTGSFDAAKALADRIRGANGYPEVFELRHVGRGDFEAAVEAWTRYDDHDLSFTDAVLVALCENEGFDGVLTFDSDFDGLVTRYEPGAHGK